MTSYRTLSGRVAVVTRGAGDVGRGICDALAAAGARVVSDETPVKPAGDTAAHAAHLQALVVRAVSAHGRLDIMVNTSIELPAMAADEMPLAQFVQGITLNLNAIFFGCQAAAAQMARQTPI